MLMPAKDLRPGTELGPCTRTGSCTHPSVVVSTVLNWLWGGGGWQRRLRQNVVRRPHFMGTDTAPAERQPSSAACHLLQEQAAWHGHPGSHHAASQVRGQEAPGGCCMFRIMLDQHVCCSLLALGQQEDGRHIVASHLLLAGRRQKSATCRPILTALTALQPSASI